MFENISVKNALKLAYEGKAILYDIRDGESYRRGHFPMAKNVVRTEIEEELKRNQEMLIVLYCEHGNQSLRLAKELSDKGYMRLASVVGGYQAYEGYVEAQKKDVWTMEWKPRGLAGEKEVDSLRMDK